MTLPQAYETRVSLWDLDNCISDDAWRTSKIDWNLEGNVRYNRYDADMAHDRPAHLAEWKIITQLSMPVFMTGRRERWRGITRRWIMNHLVLMRHDRPVWQDDPLILMRPDDNNMRPVELKAMLLKQLQEVHGIELSRVIAAVDDVQSIVDMYLLNGLPATVLRVHDPRLAYKPEDL